MAEQMKTGLGESLAEQKLVDRIRKLRGSVTKVDVKVTHYSRKMKTKMQTGDNAELGQ